MAVGVAVDDGIAIGDGVHLNLADSKFRVLRLNKVVAKVFVCSVEGSRTMAFCY